MSGTLDKLWWDTDDETETFGEIHELDCPYGCKNGLNDEPSDWQYWDEGEGFYLLECQECERTSIVYFEQTVQVTARKIPDKKCEQD